MQISTNLMFDKAISQMGKTKDRLGQVQLQLSTTKSIIKPSDSPDKTTTITRLQSAITRQDSYVSTIKNTTDKLSLQETALKSSSDILVRMKELAIQSANDTVSAQDRKEIAIEVAGLRDQIRSLANTQDVNGNYIFAGAKVSSPAFLKNPNGVIDYNGDQNRSLAQIGTSLKLQMNTPGSDAFVRVQRPDGKGGNVGVGFFQSLGDLISAVQNSDQSNIQRGLSELSSLTLGVTEANANVGTGLQAVDSQTSILSEVNLRLQTTLSDVQDLDYTTAITKMNKDQLALEAAQSSFAKISKLSLFTYM